MTRRPRQQAGYALVEIALVLGASLILASSVLVNYFNVQQERHQQQTRAELAVVKTALANYAAVHKSPGYIFVNGGIPASLRVDWRKDQGRPYLPCPDVTGDGVEDRKPMAAASSTLVLNAGGGGIEAFGGCYKQKGLLPWRTLNVPGKDLWGNRFGYHVSRNFSNAAVGFNEHTRADHGAYTRPLLPVVVAVDQTLAMRPVLDATLTNPLGGINFEEETAPALICNSAPCGHNTPAANFLLGSVVGASGATLASDGYGAANVFITLNAGKVADGAPAVVFSYGRNGNGAFDGNVQPTVPLRCYDVNLRNVDELQNAHWLDGMAVGCGDIQTFAGVTVVFEQNGFVSRARSGGLLSSTAEFDDIVVWYSVDELISQMRQRDVLPAPNLPPVGLESH